MLVNANVSERTAVRHTALSLSVSGLVAQCGGYASIHQPPEVSHAVCLLFWLNHSGSYTTPRSGQQSRSVYITVSLFPLNTSVLSDLPFSWT
jgi:hypothetical protein